MPLEDLRLRGDDEGLRGDDGGWPESAGGVTSGFSALPTGNRREEGYFFGTFYAGIKLGVGLVDGGAD